MEEELIPKVLIALTSQRMIFTRTAACFVNFLATRRPREYTCACHFDMGADIVSSRNRIVQAAREVEASHLLFIDYDMSFPPDALSKLLKYDLDIIGAAYNFRSDEVKSTAIPVEPPAPTDRIFKCEALGAGFLLIKMSVFDKLDPPYFMFGYKPDGDMLYGEDTYFCQMAKNKGGFDVWADPTLGVKHIGEHLY